MMIQLNIHEHSIELPKPFCPFIHVGIKITHKSAAKIGLFSILHSLISDLFHNFATRNDNFALASGAGRGC